MNFRNILFPVVFSRQCQLASPHVALWARSFDAEITLLHIESLPDEPYVWEPQTDRLTDMLDRFLVDDLSGLKVRRVVRKGDPAEVILSHLKTDGADIVMMPTHGRGALSRFLLGSVTAKVLHNSHSPVWTSAHLDEELPMATAQAPKNVICAVDLDERGVHTLRCAGDIARRFASRLTIAHAVPSFVTLPEQQLDTRFSADLIDAARHRLANMQEAAGIEGTLCVGAGEVAEFVSDAARSHDGNLVVIGRGGHGVIGRLRTHDYAIIRRCQVPVLSL